MNNRPCMASGTLHMLAVAIVLRLVFSPCHRLTASVPDVSQRHASGSQEAKRSGVPAHLGVVAAELEACSVGWQIPEFMAL